MIKGQGKFIHVLTPMHVGGNYEFSVVDQPIQREGHTGFPKIEASSFKGSVRHHLERQNKNVEELFGSTEQAGKLTFTDAHILFFPIRSAKGLYALITCPSILARYTKGEPIKLDGEANTYSNDLIIEGKLLLDEYVYTDIKRNDDFNQIIKSIEEKMGSAICLKQHALLLSDDDFAYFVKHHTEIITRTAIDSTTGIVKEGALFDEEYVPAEAIFYTTIYGEDKDIANLELDVLQIGGNMTIGKGFVKIYNEEAQYEKHSK